MEQTIDLRKKPGQQLKEQSPSPEQKPPQSQSSAETLVWHTHLTRTPEKKTAFTIAGGLTIATILLVWFQKDYLFATLLFLTGVLVIITAYKKASADEVGMDTAGITVGERKYRYHELKSFWLNYEPPHTKELIIEFKKKLMPIMRIPIEDINPLKIRALMVSLVPEKEYEETIIDQIARKLGI